MAEVKWIKITVNMFDDEKIKLIESMPDKDAILIIWIKLLTLAGKINSNGYIFLTENIPYTDEMLATVFNRPLNTVRLALETFKKFGMIDFDDNNILHITNWDKHQNIEGLEKIREQNRLRKRRQREREKQKLLEASLHNDEKSHVKSRDSHATEEDIEEEIDIDIEEDIDKEIDLSSKEEPPTPYKQIKDLYNEICVSLTKVRSLSDERKKHIKARWKQFNYEIKTFEEVFCKVEASDFCKGKNDRHWKADFDWLIKNDSNMVKVLEGKYDNEKPKDEYKPELLIDKLREKYGD